MFITNLLHTVLICYWLFLGHVSVSALDHPQGARPSIDVCKVCVTLCCELPEDGLQLRSKPVGPIISNK